MVIATINVSPEFILTVEFCFTIVISLTISSCTFLHKSLLKNRFIPFPVADKILCLWSRRLSKILEKKKKVLLMMDFFNFYIIFKPMQMEIFHICPSILLSCLMQNREKNNMHFQTFTFFIDFNVDLKWIISSFGVFFF